MRGGKSPGSPGHKVRGVRTRSPGHTRIRPTPQGVRDTRESVLHRAGPKSHRPTVGGGSIGVGNRTRLQGGRLQPLRFRRTQAFESGTNRRSWPIEIGWFMGGRKERGSRRQRRGASAFGDIGVGRGVRASDNDGAAASRPQAGRGVSRNCMIRSASHRRSAGPSPKARCGLRNTVVRASHRLSPPPDGPPTARPPARPWPAPARCTPPG